MDLIEDTVDKNEDMMDRKENIEDTADIIRDTIQAYRHLIRKLPIENDRVIKDKIREIKTNESISDNERTKLRNEIINAHLRYVNWLADNMWKSMLGASSDVPLEDLIQAGNVGLIKAIDKYDVAYVETPIPFIAYAKKYIQNAIKDEIEENWKNYMLNIEDESIRDSIAASDDVETDLIDIEEAHEVHTAMQTLDEIEKKALMLYHGIGDSGEIEKMPIHKISKELSISIDDTELIVDMAEQKLKKELGQKNAKE